MNDNGQNSFNNKKYLTTQKRTSAMSQLERTIWAIGKLADLLFACSRGHAKH